MSRAGAAASGSSCTMKSLTVKQTCTREPCDLLSFDSIFIYTWKCVYLPSLAWLSLYELLYLISSINIWCFFTLVSRIRRQEFKRRKLLGEQFYRWGNICVHNQKHMTWMTNDWKFPLHIFRSPVGQITYCKLIFHNMTRLWISPLVSGKEHTHKYTCTNVRMVLFRSF